MLAKILKKGLSVKEYMKMTGDIFKQIHMIKDIFENQDEPYLPLEEDEKMNFKFKKPGFKKLLLFDLDETLIHVKRS